MTATLLQMTVLIGCGVFWRIWRPGGSDAAQTRKTLTAVVYYLLLPAMVFEVLRHSRLGMNTLQYTVLGVGSILTIIALSWGVGRLCRYARPRHGAMILAAAFPNVTYLGLPVLEQTFGPWARSVAIQIDLFATAPVLFSIGAYISSHFGEDHLKETKPFWALFHTPPFWAAGIAVLFNLADWDVAPWMAKALQQAANAVVPLMLLSLGLALDWRAVRWRNAPVVVPVIVIKLGLMPTLAVLIASSLSLSGDERAAAILEMAMPSMVMGVVFCDRYGLDTSLYAMAVTVTTVLSALTLPLWLQVLRF